MAVCIRRLLMDRDYEDLLENEENPYEFYDNEQYEVQDLNHIPHNIILMELAEVISDRGLMWGLHDEYYDFNFEGFVIELEHCHVYIDEPDINGVIDICERYGEEFNKDGVRFGISPEMSYKDRLEYYDMFLDRVKMRIDFSP